MANCISCGRVLPRFSFGQRSDVCAECRAAALEVRTGSAATPASPRMAVSRPRPPVTSVLVGLNVAVFLAMALTGVSVSEPTTGQLLRWGANWGPQSLGTEPWRILSSNYLHIGILHILFNMWCLWDLGNLAERIFDRWTYLLTYTACGIAGSLASLWWHPLVVGAGASGAIFGLAGALITALYLGRLPIPAQAVRHTLRSLLVFAGYNLFFGAVGAGVDNSAHIGGLVCGLGLGAVLAQHLMSPPEVRANWRLGVFVMTAVILLAAFTAVKRARAYVVPLGQGLNALDHGQPDEAVRDLERASAQKPNDPLVLVELGQAYLHKQDYADARTVLQRAVEIDSEDAEAQYDLGFAWLKLGEAGQAIAPLEKAAQLDPKNLAVEQVLAEAYLAEHRPADAQRASDKAHQLRGAGQKP
jgi:membrane associated rhomboid family serine protease/Flp pilus assembly protein TadD